MDNRRDFLKKAALLTGAAGLSTMLPESIQRAMAIDPQAGSTYLDAEHVVILMQENRSFDHCFGSMQGVRGFNDPRAISLPNGNPVWLQENPSGDTFAPFRLNMKDTKATWMGSLPHGRSSQVDAFNYGKFNKWLEAKHSWDPNYKDMPLTLGYYNREDLPFNYALADAFTVCDQSFSSGMTSTHPNRSFFWTGTIREKESSDAWAYIRNDNNALGEYKWKTFPETLEDNHISWKIYQNDVDSGGGFVGEERAWLTNFGCNPMEFFENFNVKYSERYVNGLQIQEKKLPAEISELNDKLSKLPAGDSKREGIQRAIAKKQEVLANVKKELTIYTPENFNKLSQREKNLHLKAFTKNEGDPDFHKLATLKYTADNKEREVVIPKGDTLYAFRKDVDAGKLPAVSWIVSPQNFSDHPCAPWYGAYYVSEVLDILTKNPEVWKKTIFILTYDENDGYFDHIPPFIPPDLSKPGTGKCTPGIKTDVEYIYRENELKEGVSKGEARDGVVGLGYRVPTIIASPWSRGGQVCSQVFDHTSSIQLMEKLFSKKLGREVKHHAISQWRRTVCGDFTSAFSPFKTAKDQLPFLKKQPFVESIYNAKFLKDPSAFKKLSKADIELVKKQPVKNGLMPEQEKGIRKACALPYELHADGKLSADKKHFELHMQAGNTLFKSKAAGAPFKVYAPGKVIIKEGKAPEAGENWNYAVAAGNTLADSWPINAFENDKYHLRLYGPNGFYREFKGDAHDPDLGISLAQQVHGLTLNLANKNAAHRCTVQVIHHGYQHPAATVELAAGLPNKTVIIPTDKSFGWYDFTVKVSGFENFEVRYAGHLETGKTSFTDPVMGRV